MRQWRERFEPARTGLDHLALVAESFEHLQTWADWLDANEVSRSEIRDVGVGEMFDLVDPDGIQIEFCFTDQAKSAVHSSLPDRVERAVVHLPHLNPSWGARGCRNRPTGPDDRRRRIAT
jgi:catechol-2,3-dioxygenase